jgi:hypothetical protein
MDTENNKKSQTAGSKSFVLRTLQTIFFARQRTADRNGVFVRQNQKPDVRKSRYVLEPLVAFASISLIIMFFYGVNHYRSTLQRIQEAPQVSVLKDSLSARVIFGNSPDCNGVPCWIENEFSDTSWIQVKIPMNPSNGIRTLPGYQNGLNKDSMYYRMQLFVPDELYKSGKEIAFSPLAIQHARYQVFINGRETQSGENKSAPFKEVIISIPRSEVKDGKVNVTIKTSVRDSDVGIAYYNAALLGPEVEISDVKLSTERESTFYLFFLLSKGSIYIIFTFFFLFTKGSRGLTSFMAFAFFSSIENLFIGGFFQLPVKWIVLGFYPCRALAITGLLGFFLTFFQVHRAKRTMTILSGGFCTVILAMCIDFGWGSGRVSFDHLWGAVNLYLVVAIFVAFLAGAAGTALWKSVGHETKFRNFFWMEVLLGGYFLFIIYETYFKTYTGFDMRSAIDLFFFLYLAFISVKEFGMTEGRVVTLESHMTEKKRMEAELLEAAEIAKTFNPSEAPTWDKINIGYYHRPLTENSGDWFTFHTSPSGRFKHFILCDITGHGVQAALVVSTCKSVLASLHELVPGITESTDYIPRFMQLLNHTLYVNGVGKHASTLLGITFTEGQIHYIGAGHPNPYVLNYKTGGAQFKPLLSRGNVLGITPEYPLQEMKSYKLEKGDMLLTYSDGFPVASSHGVFKSVLSTFKTAESLEPLPLYRNIREALVERAKTPPDDDVSIVLFKFSA